MIENAKSKPTNVQGDDVNEPSELPSSSVSAPKMKEWHVGDYCMAPWGTEKKIYEAHIEKINGDFAVVRFIGYDNQETVPTKQLSKLDKSSLSKEVFEKKIHREKLLKEKERRQEKKAKWMEKVKTEEQIKEKEKKGWQDFHSKLSTKFKKRVTQKSIFASPSSVHGHVGIGTNDVGGKQPTSFKMPANRWDTHKK